MSQKNMIRRHLLAGGKISQLAALREYGCMRLADVIHKLRNEGFLIATEKRTQKGKTFAVYKIPVGLLEGEKRRWDRMVASGKRKVTE